MAISSPNVIAPRETGGQDILRLAGILQQQSQIEEQKKQFEQRRLDEIEAAKGKQLVAQQQQAQKGFDWLTAPERKVSTFMNDNASQTAYQMGRQSGTISENVDYGSFRQSITPTTQELDVFKEGDTAFQNVKNKIRQDKINNAS